MRRILLFTTLGLLLLPAAAWAEQECGSHGTSVDFVDTPSEAARQGQEGAEAGLRPARLGHFEDPRFT